MAFNPEIRRNWWLEFSLHRLIVMPLVLGVIFFIATQLVGKATPLQELRVAADMIFLLLVKIWGGYKAAESVVDEVNENTWDFQKLSALSPWSLTFGKLFGSTSYAWYGGLIALAVDVIASITEIQPFHIALGAVLLVVGALIVHATAIFSSLLVVQTNSGAHAKLRAMPHLVAGLLVGSVFSSASLLNAWVGTKYASEEYNRTILWHGMSFDRLAFLSTTSVVILAWLIVGINWQMRAQMKMRNGPWLWIAFVFFWMYFLSGFSLLPATLHVTYAFSFQEVMAFVACFGCLYAIAFHEQWNVVRYRRLTAAWHNKDYRLFFELCPRWIWTLLICIGTAAWISVHYGQATGTAFIFALLCFAVRDIAILHFFKLFPAVRKPYQTTKFYLAVLYILVPFLLAVCGAKQAVSMFVPWPFGGDNSYVYQGLIAGFIQALIALLLAYGRWRSYAKSYR